MFRFTIRELCLVMVSVSLAGAWWTERRYILAENRYLTFENTRLQAENEYVETGRSEALAIVKQAHSALQSEIAGAEARAALKSTEAVLNKNSHQ